MTRPLSDSDERRDARRTSEATRRIVVENLPPEEVPLARGRRLDVPADIETTSRRSAAASHSLREDQRSARLNRNTLSNQITSRTVSTEIRGSGHRSATVSNKGTPKRSSSDRVNVKRLILITGGIVILPFVAIAILFLLPSSGNKKIARESAQALSTPLPGSESAAPEVAAVNPSPLPEVSAAGSQPSIETSPDGPGPTSVTSAEIRSMTVQLASQISQKSGYEFAQEFVELIRARTQEYNSQKALGGARQYRREINKSFRDEGLNPLIGYALAMSRSKFDPAKTEKGLGLWQVPASVARSQGYLGATENSAKLKIPEASAQITSSYTKQLLSAFDAEDFMYAIACFGMSLQEAGRLQARLVNAAPDTKSRRDIMKMIRAGVLTADQVDNIARFFAAGIVGENPQKFGLDDSQPFSSLY